MRASVTCTVATGDSPIDIKWLKDNQLLQPAPDIQVEKSDEFISTLIFKHLKPEHSGSYSCIASNEAASENHTVALSVDCE